MMKSLHLASAVAAFLSLGLAFTPASFAGYFWSNYYYKCPCEYMSMFSVAKKQASLAGFNLPFAFDACEKEEVSGNVLEISGGQGADEDDDSDDAECTISFEARSRPGDLMSCEYEFRCRSLIVDSENEDDAFFLGLELETFSVKRLPACRRVIETIAGIFDLKSSCEVD
jgi:hypothetical protein